jgi:hypothetical protein
MSKKELAAVLLKTAKKRQGERFMPEFKGEAPFWKFGLSDPFHPASLPIGLPSGGHLNLLFFA